MSVEMSSNDDRLDSAWSRWDQVLRAVLDCLRNQDLKAALAKVDSFLSGSTIPEVHSSALGMKAELLAGIGDLDGARETLLLARSLIGPSFGKYVHEISLAETYRKEKRSEEALRWYRNALRTSVEAKISGGGALKKFLDLWAGPTLLEEDRKLSFAVAMQSWSTLGLPGNPNLADLAGVASALIEGESTLPDRR